MKEVKVIPPRGLYKWAKNFKRIQDRFYNNKFKLRRIQQIEDFVVLNGFKKVFHIEEVLIDLEVPEVSNINDSDIIVVTHPGYSRYPLNGIVEQINNWLDTTPDLYLCLNRHYLNINNAKINLKLPEDYQQAITSWLQQSLNESVVVDLSRNYLDNGQNFTWSVPDRHFYIKRC